MLIPIHDENPTSRRAWVTLALIAANVLAFILWQPTFASGPNADLRQQVFFYCHAEIPWELTHQTNLAHGGAAAARAIHADTGIPGRALQRVLAGRSREARVRGLPSCPDKSWLLSIFTAMFMHASWLHIGGNMLFLWVFGNNIEDRVGRIRYLVFYLLSGIAATVAQVLIGPGSAVPNLGASGAIAGVLGAYLVLYPRARVFSLVPIAFIFTLIPLPAVVVLGFWFILQVFSGTGSLAQHVNGGVAYFAHIGGFVFGALAALLVFRRLRRRPVRAPAW